MTLILPTNSVKDTGGYQVANSCRFNRADSAILSKTFSGDGTHHDKGTISLWIKRNELGAEEVLFSAGASGREFFRFETNDTLTFRSTSEGFHLNTNRVFRDVSAWYHFVLALDSTQGTASNRIKIYVNGVQETSFATETYTPNQNMDHKILSGELNTLGKDSEQNAFASCYFCEVIGIDGQQLTPTSFGEFDEDTGIWKPKDVSGLTFGTNGFYLDFEDSSALGNDVSGNNNDFANTNLATTDQSTDTCTNNFATLNLLAINNNTSANYITLSEGNLKAVGNSTSNNGNGYSTIGFTKGKWYMEVKILGTSTHYPNLGIVPLRTLQRLGSQTGQVGSDTDSFAYIATGNKENNGTSSYGNSFTTNDIIGIAVDLDNGAIYFSKNGTFQASGDPTSGASKTNSAFGFTVLDEEYFFGFAVYKSASIIECNFGSPPYSESGGNSDGNGYGNFAGSVPANYYCLNTKNLAEFG